jgi:hypothetical protein
VGEERSEREWANGNAKNVGIPCRLTNHLKSVPGVKRSVSLWMFHVTSQIVEIQVLTQGWDNGNCEVLSQMTKACLVESGGVSTGDE